MFTDEASGIPLRSRVHQRVGRVDATTVCMPVRITALAALYSDDAMNRRRPPLAVYGGALVSILLVAISLAGILGPATYARETPNWSTQAVAQDWFDLIVVAPALFLTALWAARGSRRGQLVFAGVLLDTIYTLVIYAFAVHLNSLFLVYCAALGVAIYTLIGLAHAIAREGVERVEFRPPRRIAGGFLIGVGIAFSGLWLLQLIPAALTGREPADLAETGLLTNPVHVIDLSFILPLHVIAGIALWRRRPIGQLLAPVVLAFGALMSASIGVLVIMMEARGIAGGGYPIAAAMAAVAILSSALLVASLRSHR